jgi:CHAT domain-containing protein
MPGPGRSILADAPLAARARDRAAAFEAVCSWSRRAWLPLAVGLTLLEGPALSRPIPLPILVNATRSCGAAWISDPGQAVHWARVGTAEGVLTVGPEIVARLDLSERRMQVRSREHPKAILPNSSVMMQAQAPVLNIDSQFSIDSSCRLTIRGPVTEIFNPEFTDQAAARSLLGDASDAAERGDAEQAGALAARAFDLLSPIKVSDFPQKLEFAAAAVEALLQAGHRDKASEILGEVSDGQAPGLARNHPSKLRIELALARALSFADRDEQALKLRRALQPEVLAIFGSMSDESLWNRLRIANLESELGDYERARRELEALRASIYRNRSPGALLRIYATRALADALTMLGRERDSVELLGRLRDELVSARGEDDGSVIDVDEKLARNRIRLGQLDPALQGASRVFLWRNEHLGFTSVQTLQSSWTLALLYSQFGRYDTARALIDESLEAANRAATNVPRLLALKMQVVLGNIEGAQGHVDTAEEILRSAWQQYGAVTGRDSMDTARAMVSYALLLAQTGRLDRICPSLREAFDAKRSDKRPDLQIRAASKILNGLCLLTGGGAEQAGLAGIQAGWEDLRSREGAGSHSAMYALSMLAWAHYRSGDRQAAKRLLQDLVAQAEQSRFETPAGSYVHDYWFSNWITDRSQSVGYRTLALLHAEDGDLGEAIRISELARDRRLRDRFAERYRPLANLPDDERDELRSMTSRIQALDEQLALDVSIGYRIQLESRRTLAVAARDRYERRIGRRNGPDDFREASSLSSLRALLAAGTAIASIQRSGDRWWAVVVARDAPARLVMFDREPDLDAAVRAWVGLLAGEPVRAWPAAGNRVILGYERPSAALGHHLSRQHLGERIGRAIFAPLASAAPQARRFVVVADDELSGVPFGAMPVDGVAAIEQFEISYAPSLLTYATLCRSADRPAWSRDLLSIAVDDVPQVRAPGDGGTGDTGDSIRQVLEFASRHPLPFASKEVEAASRSFAPARTTVLRGPEASKSMLLAASRDGSLSSYRYVHIAAHAFSFPDDPERSMLVLNAPPAAGEAGRVLTAAELANLQMGSELLVLAACSTAVGRYEPGQGRLGFEFAALAAGNRAALLSLWEVADDLTERFISGFFGHLTHGMQPATALRATQLEFARDPDPRINDPGAWAAFVLYGRS